MALNALEPLVNRILAHLWLYVLCPHTQGWASWLGESAGNQSLTTPAMPGTVSVITADGRVIVVSPPSPILYTHPHTLNPSTSQVLLNNTCDIYLCSACSVCLLPSGHTERLRPDGERDPVWQP